MTPLASCPPCCARMNRVGVAMGARSTDERHSPPGSQTEGLPVPRTEGLPVPRPKVCLIPAQGNALGSSSNLYFFLFNCPADPGTSTPSQNPTIPLFSSAPKFFPPGPQALPWAGMNVALGVVPTVLRAHEPR